MQAGRKLRFESVTSDEDQVINDPTVGAVFVATRHHQHAEQVIKAIKAGKHVYVEKPLCINEQQLRRIERALGDTNGDGPILMVGFNRRFSKLALAVRDFFSQVTTPLTICVRFNAGYLAADHWAQDPIIGGGRIIGEACHGIDLATYLADSPPVRVFAESIGGPDAPQVSDDQCFITLRHANGSISSIAYLAGGDRVYEKERIEIMGGGRLAVIEDFRRLTLCHRGKTSKRKYRRQDKGHQQAIDAFASALSNGRAWPIPWPHLRAVSLASIRAVRSLRQNTPLEIA